MEFQMNEVKKNYDLIEVIQIMKDNKVLKVQMGGLTVELSPTAFIKELTTQEIEKMIKDVPPEHINQPEYNLTEEDMLKMCSPFPFK
jgi:L-cysteine desulfidase